MFAEVEFMSITETLFSINTTTTVAKDNADKVERFDIATHITIEQERELRRSVYELLKGTMNGEHERKPKERNIQSHHKESQDDKYETAYAHNSHVPQSREDGNSDVRLHNPYSPVFFDAEDNLGQGSSGFYCGSLAQKSKDN